MCHIHGKPVEGDQFFSLGSESFIHVVDIQCGADQTPDFCDDLHLVGQPLGCLPVPALFLLHPPLICDVTKAPHPAGNLISQSPRLRKSLKNTTVREFQNVETLHFRLRMQLLHLLNKASRMLELTQQMIHQYFIVPHCRERFGNMPQGEKFFVVYNDIPVIIADKNPVGGGFQDGCQKRPGPLGGLFRLLPLRCASLLCRQIRCAGSRPLPMVVLLSFVASSILPFLRTLRLDKGSCS